MVMIAHIHHVSHVAHIDYTDYFEVSQFAQSTQMLSITSEKPLFFKEGRGTAQPKNIRPNNLFYNERNKNEKKR